MIKKIFKYFIQTNEGGIHRESIRATSYRNDFSGETPTYYLYIHYDYVIGNNNLIGTLTYKNKKDRDEDNRKICKSAKKQ